MRPQSLLSPITLQQPQVTSCNTKEDRVLEQAQVLWRGIKRWGLLTPANTQGGPSLLSALHMSSCSPDTTQSCWSSLLGHPTSHVCRHLRVQP